MQFYFSILIVVSMIGLSSCFSSKNSNYFRSPHLEATSLGYKPPKKIKMETVGCGPTLLKAQQTAKHNAKYNLRSVMGNQRYIGKFREIRYFMKDKQFCVQVHAIAH